MDEAKRYRIGFRVGDGRTDQLNHLWDSGEMVHGSDYDRLAAKLAVAEEYLGYLANSTTPDFKAVQSVAKQGIARIAALTKVVPDP